MLNNAISRSGPELTDGVLRSLESELGYVLPEEYRQFLLEHNGGVPAKAMFNYGADHRQAWVDDFVEISPDLTRPNPAAKVSTLSFWMSVYGHITPSEIFRIGTVCRDDWLIIGLSSELRGQVHVVRWEDMPAGRQETQADVLNAMKYVASTFTDFYLLLY